MFNRNNIGSTNNNIGSTNDTTKGQDTNSNRKQNIKVT